MGFENRCDVDGAAAIAQSQLNGVVRGRYSRCFVPFVIKFRSRTIKTAFLVDTSGTCTYLGKPTWDKLLEGLEDVGGNTLRVTLNGETRQEVTLSPQDRHFADIDLVGTDFFNHMEARFRVDYKTKICALEWTNPRLLGPNGTWKIATCYHLCLSSLPLVPCATSIGIMGGVQWRRDASCALTEFIQRRVRYTYVRQRVVTATKLRRESSSDISYSFLSFIEKYVVESTENLTVLNGFLRHPHETVWLCFDMMLCSHVP